MKTNKRICTARGAIHSNQRGSMMVEVLVSVVLLSVSVLGLVRVLAQSVKDSGELEYRSVASAVADETIGRMWVADPATLEATFEEDAAPLAQLPNGWRTVTVDPVTSIVTVRIGWQVPGGTASQYFISATLAKNP